MTRGLLLCDDLFFGTKVTGTARGLGLRVDDVPTVTALEAALEGDDGPVALVLIDLGLAGVAVADVVAALPVEADRPRIVAFGSHVDTTRLQEARAAGCDDVLPRSRFSVELPEILRSTLTA